MRILTIERQSWKPTDRARKMLVKPEHYAHLEAINESVVIHDAETGRVVAAQLLADDAVKPDLEALARHLRLGVEWEPEGPRASGIAYAQRTFGTSAPSPMRRRYGCAPNSFNLQYPATGILLEKLANKWFEMFVGLDPERAEEHRDLIYKNIHPDWMMDGAPWTSGVINKTAALPYHCDKGNIVGSWSVMLGMRRGVEGGHLHLPEYDVLLGIPDGSVTYFDGQGTWHGVTPFELTRKDAYRFTLVWYAKTLCRDCGPKEHEAERAAKKATTQPFSQGGVWTQEKRKQLPVTEYTIHDAGRATEPVTELQAGMDFRKPEYRREVFHRFYQYHLKYRSHPGCVYYTIPHLRDTQGWDDEQTLWFAFLNGNTQNPVVSWLLHRQFPTPEYTEPMIEWFEANYERLPFDTDRRHHKKNLPQASRAYAQMTMRGQQEFWLEAAQGGFAGVWEKATKVPSFGRLSAFSYSEYLRICGLPFDCDNLLLDDLSGSKSHRNGLAKVCGRDDLDWHDSNPAGFDGCYSPEQMQWLMDEGALLLEEAKHRAAGSDYENDVSYFTLESALCTYKSWHRVNRRYPNVYNDLLHARIRKTEELWPDVDFGVFWEARQRFLPEHLRLEDNPADPGCVPTKQNHYRLTGQVIMMDEYDAVFRNDFNDAIRKAQGDKA